MSRLLVIGYGNTLRRDDGAGVRAAEAAAGSDLIDVVTTHELQPELAELLSRYTSVVFVDASFETASLRCRPIAPGTGSHASHTRSPAELLALADALYGTSPVRALQIEIPARDVGFGETLTDGALEDVRTTREMLLSIAADPVAVRSTV